MGNEYGNRPGVLEPVVPLADDQGAIGRMENEGGVIVQLTEEAAKPPVKQPVFPKLGKYDA